MMTLSYVASGFTRKDWAMAFGVKSRSNCTALAHWLHQSGYSAPFWCDGF
jgi:hypothetical protein